MSKTSKYPRGGFTLIELLVVVLIIGILAAIALPQYKQVVLKAQLTQMIVYVDALKKGAELYYMINGNYPNNVSSIDLDITGTAIEFGQSTKITTSTTVAALFPDGVECVVYYNYVACISKDFYLFRSTDNSNYVHYSARGTLCMPGYGPHKTRAEKICKSLSNESSLGKYDGLYDIYRIGN